MGATAPRASHRASVRVVVIGALMLIAAAMLFIAMFDWSALRAPIERRVSAATRQPVSIGALDVGWQGGPRLLATDVMVGGDGTKSPPLLKARELSVILSPWRLLVAKLHFDEVGMRGARIHLLRDRAGRVNWERPDRQRTAAADEGGVPTWRTLGIERLVLDDVALTWRDEMQDAEATVHVTTIDSGATPQRGPESAPATPWQTRYTLRGRYRATPFSGEVYTGALLALRDPAGAPFPIKGNVEIARTRLQAEGGISRPLDDAKFDVRMSVSGPSLATWYPTVPVVLPATPPYRLDGRVRLESGVYSVEHLTGRIGTTDIAGQMTFDARPATPRLTGKLTSQNIALSDLGRTIGIGDDTAPPTSRLIPDMPFDLPRMQAMNADVSLDARQVIVHGRLPFQGFSTHVVLTDGVLKLSPLNFGFAGGQIVSTIVLDARQRPIQADAAIDARRVDIAQIIPAADGGRVSAGPMGAQLRLKGRGQSIAQLLGNAEGGLAAAMSGGQISRAAVAAASLDGGKLLPILLTGDRPVEVRCIAALMDVKQGVARTELMIGDFTTARVDGGGTVDLGGERLDLEVRVLPKQPSVLSLRAPLHVTGTFKDPEVAVGAEAYVRGGAAVALGFVNPLAALLPLIETGPGRDANCGDVLAASDAAVKQAETTSRSAPAVAAKAPGVAARTASPVKTPQK